MLAAVAAFVAVVWSVGTAGAQGIVVLNHDHPECERDTEDYACNEDPNAGRSERDDKPPAQPERQLPGLGIAFDFTPSDSFCAPALAAIRAAGRDVAAYVWIDDETRYEESETVLRQLRISRYGLGALQSNNPSSVCVMQVVPAAS